MTSVFGNVFRLSGGSSVWANVFVLEETVVYTRRGVLVGASKKIGALEGTTKKAGTICGVMKTIGTLTGNSP